MMMNLPVSCSTRRPLLLFAAVGLLSLTGCASAQHHPTPVAHPPLAKPQPVTHASHPLGSDEERFIADLQKQGFDPAAVRQSLAAAEIDDTVLRLIGANKKPAADGTKPVRSWSGYRKRFLDVRRIRDGITFYHEHRDALERATAQYGVPPEIIVAILGVETHYGKNTGNFQTLSALATLAFHHPPRAELFRKQLAELFLLARAEGRPIESYTGSFAGAIGYPQFLPSSIREYATDFDGDGHIDLENSPIDAIGSVAHYLAGHGWQRGQPIAERLYGTSAQAQSLVERGAQPEIPPATLRAAGFTPTPQFSAALVDLPTPGKPTEYWAGYQNFYVITRYNRSYFYAMSVYQLGEAIRQGW